MSPRVAVSAVLSLLAVSKSVFAQDSDTGVTSTFPATPLASKTFSYPSGIPYQVDEEPHLIRGRQTGYNQCNSTTEGQESLCQTSFLNSLDDFCLWGSPEANSIVANTEGEMVAWCTKAGRGTRVIPRDALKGVQFIRTPDYVQVVGFIDQTKVNIQAGDYGGELDPHGADLRGNPLGGLMYSNAFSDSNDTYQQIIEWTNFMGSDAFCFKACDPAGPNAAHYCEHIYDRIGCAYNMPNQAKNGTFEACKGESQDYPGVYTENGQVMTYSQPPEGVEPSPTYTPRIPASSDCITFSSQELYTASVSGESSSPSSSGSASSGSRTASSGQAAVTSGPSTAAEDSQGAANTVRMTKAGLFGIMLSTFFFV